MIKISILYPHKPGSHFDVDYYLNIHMPLVIELLGPALKSATAEIGVSGGVPDQAPPYAAIACFTAESTQIFTEALAPHSEKLLADIPNYTDIEPVVQKSEIRLSH